VILQNYVDMMQWSSSLSVPVSSGSRKFWWGSAKI